MDKLLPGLAESFLHLIDKDALLKKANENAHNGQTDKEDPTLSRMGETLYLNSYRRMLPLINYI